MQRMLLALVLLTLVAGCASPNARQTHDAGPAESSQGGGTEVHGQVIAVDRNASSNTTAPTPGDERSSS